MKNGFKVIDADLHVTEPLRLWEERLPEPYRSTTKILAPGGPEEHSNYQFRVGEFTFSPYSEFVAGQAVRRWKMDPAAAQMAEFNRNPTPKLLLEGMAAEGMDIAAIVPTLTFIMTTCDGLPGKHALAICRAFNDWCAEFVATDRSRFRFWGWLPRQEAELAAEEANRCVKELGADGVGFTTGAVNGKLLSDPFFEPLWKEVQKLDVPFGLHLWGQARAMKDDTARRYWNQPHGQGPLIALNGVMHGMSSITELIYSGVLERYPKLRPVIMEAGSGWLLFLLDRLDEKWEMFEPEFEQTCGVKLSMKPSEYFRRQCYVTCEGDEHALKYLVDYGLADNIVFSTDYPHHDASWPHAVEHLLAQELPVEVKRKILSDNTERLFHWKAFVDR